MPDESSSGPQSVRWQVPEVCAIERRKELSPCETELLTGNRVETWPQREAKSKTNTNKQMRPFVWVVYPFLYDIQLCFVFPLEFLNNSC